MKLPDPKQFVGRVLPILKWSRTYDLKTTIGDLIAGITIALTLIPQSIAYASLAGFEPQYGLYASFAGGFVYAVMGTCPQINIGPTALLSLLTFTYTHDTNADFAVLLCFIGGIVQLIAGSAQLGFLVEFVSLPVVSGFTSAAYQGFLVEFVSLPVVSGFTSAAAITIASSQIKGLLGLKFNAESFVGTWTGVFSHIQETRLQDTLLSLVCCIVLIGMKALKDIRIKDPENEKGRRTAVAIQRTLWFIGVSRNAVVVLLAAVLAYFVHQDKGDPLILTGNITPGLPKPQLPPFYTTVGNTTYTAGGMFSHIGSGLFIVPMVGIISNVAIAKAFAKGRTLDATQEIVALGACNIIGAFFRSYPVNGSFTRSAVSDASGVRTPAAGFYTGVIVLLTLALLTPYFYFIPRAALAAVIVCAVLHMVDVAIMKRLWVSSRLDLIPLVGTFICCLALGIEVGLICGVGVDVILLLYYHSRPPLDLQFVDDGILPPHYAIHPVGGLHFAGAERVRSKLTTIRNSKFPRPRPITTLETLTVIPDSDVGNGHNIGNGTTVVISDTTRSEINAVGNGNQLVGNGSNYIANGANGLGNGSNLMGGRRTANILVIYCDGLYRMDYTFLQSIKMVASEWLSNGCLIWCNAKPNIKEQLMSVLHDPVFCDIDQLSLFLMNVSVIEGPQLSVISDTQL